MKEEWLAALRVNPQARLLKKRTVTHPSQPGLSAEITLVLQQDSVLAHPGFLVHLAESTMAPGGGGMGLNALSPAEREATLLAAEGLSNDDIARRLGISTAAVKQRLHGAFKKLNVRSRTHLATMLR